MALNREKVLEAAQKLIEKRKYDKAVIELRRVTDHDPTDVRTLQKIGELQTKQGLYTEAIDTFESVGKLYAGSGFAHKAVAVYKQIREMIATHAPQAAVRYGHIAPKLAELYREIGLGNEALVLLEEVVVTLQRQGRDAETIEYLRHISEIDAQNPLTHLRLAEGLSRSNDADGAVASIKTASRILIEGNRNDDAIQVLERCLQYKADAEAARQCAELYLARNRPPHDPLHALGKLQVCLAANPQDVEVLGLIVRAFQMAGERDKAAAVQQQIARLSQGR